MHESVFSMSYELRSYTNAKTDREILERAITLHEENPRMEFVAVGWPELYMYHDWPYGKYVDAKIADVLDTPTGYLAYASAECFHRAEHWNEYRSSAELNRRRICNRKGE